MLDGSYSSEDITSASAATARESSAPPQAASFRSALGASVVVAAGADRQPFKGSEQAWGAAAAPATRPKDSIGFSPAPPAALALGPNTSSAAEIPKAGGSETGLQQGVLRTTTDMLRTDAIVISTAGNASGATAGANAPLHAPVPAAGTSTGGVGPASGNASIDKFQVYRAPIEATVASLQAELAELDVAAAALAEQQSALRRQEAALLAKRNEVRCNLETAQAAVLRLLPSITASGEAEAARKSSCRITGSTAAAAAVTATVAPQFQPTSDSSMECGRIAVGAVESVASRTHLSGSAHREPVSERLVTEAPAAPPAGLAVAVVPTDFSGGTVAANAGLGCHGSLRQVGGAEASAPVSTLKGLPVVVDLSESQDDLEG